MDGNSRFQLKFHRETRELPVYVLTVGKDGPGIKPVEAPPPREPAGYFDVQLQFAPDSITGNPFGLPAPIPPGAGPAPVPGGGPISSVGASDPQGPAIFTAIQEQLGLKLDSSRNPVEVLIIESAEKPSEN